MKKIVVREVLESRGRPGKERKESNRSRGTKKVKNLWSNRNGKITKKY